MKEHNQEEADTGIILHALDVTKRNPFTDLVISCSDTDVLLLLLHYFDDLCTSTVFRTLKHDIELGEVHEHLGREICKSLLGFHALTGCDQTGKFFGFTKLSCWKNLMQCQPDVVNALQKLGDCTTTEVEAGLTTFVLQLYCKTRPNTVTSLASLRWYLFSKYQFESEKMPPTLATFHQKILRASFTAKQWKSAHTPVPDLPNPEECGWKWNGTIYQPIMTTQDPAPTSVIELSMCQCKTGCSNLRCRCKKYGLICTEMCLCQECENEEENDATIDTDDDDME